MKFLKPHNLSREVLPPRIWPVVAITGWTLVIAVLAMVAMVYIILLIDLAST